MKKKFSLWFNIATICLCVCAIAIGVYAAQSATLTVSGSIGFEAHNVEYTATAKAKNYATDEEGENVKEELTDVTATQGTHANNELSLTAMYFSDKSGEVPNIELEITITNNSKFDISITPESATHGNTNVSITSPNATSATKSGGTATLTYILSLQKNTSDEYEDITTDTDKALTIKIKLDKKVASTYKTDTNGNEIVVNKFNENDITTIRANTVEKYNSDGNGYGYTSDSKSYAEYFPYYITMGSKDETDIEWLIVGTIENKVLTALSDEELTRIEETRRLLKDTTYVALSAEALEKREFNADSNSYSTGENANDYYLSDIRTYLTSTETSGDNKGFASTYSLTGINIVKRAVSELYADIDEKDEVTSGKSTIADDNTEADSFWLLSQAEVYTLFKVDTSETRYYSASITTVQGTSSPCWWCLRSPYSSISNYARDVYFDGRVVNGNSVNNAGGAVRAAFQF